MQIKNKQILLILFFSLIFVGCKSKKSVVKEDGKIVKKGISEVVKDITQAQVDYTTISTKGSIELIKGNSSKKVTTFFKIVKDSAIQASVRPVLGLEVIKITITPDSVFVIDRLKQQYIAEEFASIAKVRGIDFNYYNLQALLTNQLFVPGSKEINKKSHKELDVSFTPDLYMLTAIDKNQMTYNFAINASDKIVSTLVHDLKKVFTLQWSYEDFVTDGTYNYPQTMKVNLGAGDRRFDVAIRFSKLDIDKKMKLEYMPPKSYEKIGLKELVSSYIKLK